MRLGLIRDFQEINYPKKQTTLDAENTERRNKEDFCFGIFLFGSLLEA